MNQHGERRARVVFIVELPLTDRDYLRFGIATFLQNGFAVIVLETGKFLHRGKTFPYKPSTAEFSEIDKRSVDDWVDLCREQETLAKADLIICAFGSGFVFPENFPIFRAISRTQTPYLLMMSNYLPVDYEFSSNASERISILKAKILRMDLIRSILARLPPWACGLRPASYVVFGGQRSVLNRPLLTKETAVIHAHTMDYDLYLQEQNKSIGADETAVYIDQNIGMHPDAIKLSGRGVASIDRFYPALNKLLHRFEIQTGLQVVIAAHPRTENAKIKKLLPGRKVYHGATSNLIRESRIVIASYSTAIGLAVLFEKPILIITSDEIKANRYLVGVIENMAHSLGVLPINIDQVDEIDFAEAAAIHTEQRMKYINNFIKRKGSPVKPYWEIVIDTIRERYPQRAINDFPPNTNLGAGA